LTDYAPASSLGWLDLDAAGSERVGILLRSLEEPGTLDPLGLGSVRDVFSAMLSPGTSTIQTRLRYFLFLPWIFQRLEAQRVAPADFADSLRDAEARLIDCLRHLGPNQGVIGFTAGREVKRMPSAAYWGGLGAWGIRKLDLALTEYGQRAAAFGRRRLDRDDDGNVMTRPVTMWAPTLDPPADFLSEDVTFELRRGEAELLVDHIRGHHPGSLLAVMCQTSELAADAEFPWGVPARSLPPHLHEVLRHAQCYSELTVGPQHVYNLLLARKARSEFGWDTSELETRELDHLNSWVELIASRYEEHCSWVNDLPAFWAFLAPFDSTSVRTQGFVQAVVTRAVQDPAGFAEDSIVHRTLREREVLLKTKRARLAHRSALETWNQRPFGAQLNYRWPITRSYLADIVAGMKARN
jgi:hypothetical protein